jgi:ADP-ribose pyrophosphatase YjhB (NUDIX family)
MATPWMAAGVLFRDERGRVLLVKPSYKAGWEIPGGYVEPGESPKQAASREVREELGVQPPIGRLLVVDGAPHPDEGDKVLFIFDGGELGNGSIFPAARTRSKKLSSGTTLTLQISCRHAFAIVSQWRCTSGNATRTWSTEGAPTGNRRVPTP